MQIENDPNHARNSQHDHDPKRDEHDEHEHERKHVKIEVDNHQKNVEAGSHLVSEFKVLVHVDPTKDLDELIDGVLTRLEDHARVTITGGEIFFSHVKHGGSS